MQVLLTTDQVAQWRDRIRQIADSIITLEREREALHRKLEMVSELFGDQVLKAQDDGVPGAATRKTKHRPISFPQEIRRVVESADGSVTYAELRDRLMQGQMVEALRTSDKGFYHGIARLQKQGKIVNHKGHLFSAVAFAKHMSDVKSGRKEDIAGPSVGRSSPMADAIIGFLAERSDGAQGPEIIAFLKKDDRFTDTLTKNNTGAYNVLARLLSRGEIRKNERTYYPLKENEPPEGGSETGEVDASPKSFAQEGSGDLHDLFS
jgi:hypothetical protein